MAPTFRHVDSVKTIQSKASGGMSKKDDPSDKCCMIVGARYADLIHSRCSNCAMLSCLCHIKIRNRCRSEESVTDLQILERIPCQRHVLSRVDLKSTCVYEGVRCDLGAIIMGAWDESALLENVTLTRRTGGSITHFGVPHWVEISEACLHHQNKSSLKHKGGVDLANARCA